jgi:hypothetical protein
MLQRKSVFVEITNFLLIFLCLYPNYYRNYCDVFLYFCTLPYYFYFVFLSQAKKLQVGMPASPKMPNFKVVASSLRSERQKKYSERQKNIKLNI